LSQHSTWIGGAGAFRIEADSSADEELLEASPAGRDSEYDRLPTCGTILRYTGGLQRFVYPVPVALFAALAIGAWAGAPQTSATKSTKKKSTLKAKRPVVVAHRPVQQPTPERYKEIQQALADKGYFRSEPDGNWGPTSIDALKRFQHDQKLAEDGKIGSLSLIALGLGPKREPAVETEQKQP
jgi:hypothetical protein